MSLIVNWIPLYYSGLIEKKVFLLIRDDLVNHLVSEYIRDKTYQILFTFSRILTLRKEEILANFIVNNSETTDDKLFLLEELYNQINPNFRWVEIENKSLISSICYSPSRKGTSSNSGFTEKDAETSQSEYIQLRYENASDKLASLNFCQSPLEKIYMIKWVAESIKQDGQIILENNKAPRGIWADTLISIYAYISAQSQNHFLYAHWYLTKTLITEDMNFQTQEGYYLCILEAALSLLWDHMDKTHELMKTISLYESSQELNCKDSSEHSSSKYINQLTDESFSWD